MSRCSIKHNTVEELGFFFQRTLSSAYGHANKRHGRKRLSDGAGLQENNTGWREHFMSPKVSMFSACDKVYLTCKVTTHPSFEIKRTELQCLQFPFSQTEGPSSQKLHHGTTSPRPQTHMMSLLLLSTPEKL